MLQRSSLPSTSTAEIADTLQRSFGERAWDRPGWQALPKLMPLPGTWQQYLLACVALAVVLGGLLLHVLLSVQIARADFQLRQLRDAYGRVERQNSELVYQIAQRSSLAQMAQLAAAQGYAPATGRTYTVRSSDALAGAASSAGSPATSTSLPQTAPTAADAAAASSPAWLGQIGQWWKDTSQAAGAATAQLWRDITGRME
jgi:hypothetical protein